jgi:hypothetical protein
LGNIPHFRAEELSNWELFSHEVGIMSSWVQWSPGLSFDWLMKHPRSVGESYFQHQRHALQFCAAMIGAGLCCGIHALVPALFERTGSTTIAKLHERMVAQRRRQYPEDMSGKPTGEAPSFPLWSTLMSEYVDRGSGI